jgi:hypothetical protein
LTVVRQQQVVPGMAPLGNAGSGNIDNQFREAAAEEKV